MRVLDYVPEVFKQYVKLVRLRRKFPGCIIGTHMIAENAVLGMKCTIARDVEISAHVSIGDHSYINAGTILASGSVGKFCSIGYYCQIGMPEHPIDYLSTSPRTYGSRNIFGIPSLWDDYSAPPVIENDVWIGSQVLILQKVRIGNGAILAGGSVVTRDVPPYTIVAGVPAKPVRKRFDESVIKVLLELAWWDIPVADLHQWSRVFGLGNRAAEYLAQRTREPGRE